MNNLLLVSEDFENYKLIDSGDGQRLEKFGDFFVVKPDPQAIWKKKTDLWYKVDLIYEKENGGYWKNLNKVPESWEITWKDLKFKVKPTPFKHLGIFPEQAAHWIWAIDLIQKNKRENKTPKVLNLFGYTGTFSIACAKAGAEVTHVDASKNAISWTKENEELSGIKNSIRVINEDCLKFVKREITRGNKYDLIIADPPAFGHGVKNEVWRFNYDFPELLQAISEVMSEDAIGVLVNAYAISSSAVMLGNMFDDYLPKGDITYGELCLKESTSRLFSTGIFARWEKSKR